MQPEYFEQLLDSRFENVKTQHTHIEDKLNAILIQTTKTNGRVSELEKDMNKIKQIQANDSGHWSGVSKTILIFITLLGIILGAVTTMLWH